MTVLVTGGAGLIGSRIVRALLAAGARPIVLDTMNAYPDCTYSLFGRHMPDVEVHVGDVCDRDLVRRLMTDSDYVVHAAAYADVAACTHNVGEAFRSNVAGTQTILEMVRERNDRIRRFLFVSSASVYGDYVPPNGLYREDMPIDPISNYANSKAWGERQTRQLLEPVGVEHVSLRYFSVYGAPQVPKKGSHSWCVALFAMQAALNRTLRLNNAGRQVRDFVHVDDIAAATVRALYVPQAANLSINVGTGIATSVRSIADSVASFHAGLVMQNTPRPAGDPLGAAADIELMQRVLNWKPSIMIRDGILDYREWVQSTPQAIPAWLAEGTT